MCTLPNTRGLVRPFLWLPRHENNHPITAMPNPYEATTWTLDLERSLFHKCQISLGLFILAADSVLASLWTPTSSSLLAPSTLQQCCCCCCCTDSTSLAGDFINTGRKVLQYCSITTTSNLTAPMISPTNTCSAKLGELVSRSHTSSHLSPTSNLRRILHFASESQSGPSLVNFYFY